MGTSKEIDKEIIKLLLVLNGLVFTFVFLIKLLFDNVKPMRERIVYLLVGVICILFLAKNSAKMGYSIVAIRAMVLIIIIDGLMFVNVNENKIPKLQ